MKRSMKVYESCKTSIRIAFFGFVLIAIGFLIQNKNVNLFYTFKSSIILFIGEFCLKLGEFIVMNLPIIFMLNGVCKKENNAAPVVTALVGYFTFVVTTMLFASQTLDSTAYSTSFGMNSVFNLTTGTRLPLETGMIGSLIVALATRFAFILSRHRGNLSLTNLFSKDIAGIVYNVLFCFIGGLLIAYVYPFVFIYIQKGIKFISEDLNDPVRIATYSVADRALSIIGLGNVIRNPFWFTSLGGSIQNTSTGQAILGDVNIWSYVTNTVSDYSGAGRFITPYYVINMFMIPGIYIGTILSMSDKKDRAGTVLAFLGAIALSIVAGNPLPVELLMLFTSPFLLAIYLILVGCSSYALVSMEAFLGFETTSANTIVAMPGSFPDFIINARNANLSGSMWLIVIIGLIALVLCVLATMLYYRYLAFSFANDQAASETVDSIIKAVGGKENIIEAGSGLFKVNIYLRNPEFFFIDKIRKTGVRKVTESKDAISFEFGTSSYAIAKLINKVVKN